MFFLNNTSKLSAIFINLINTLYGNSEITDECLLQLFRTTKNDFISDKIRQEWEKEFCRHGIIETYQQNQYIYLMLLTDLVNLLKLSQDPEYKFIIYTILTKEVSCIGQPIIMISLDITNNNVISPTDVIISFDNNQKLQYKRFIHLENKICYYFDKSQIIAKKINFIKIAYLTPKGRFESEEIKI